MVVHTPRRRGRPRRVTGETSSVRVWVLVAPSEHAALCRLAHAQRQTIADVVRDAVNEYVSDCGEAQVFPAQVIRGGM